MKEKFFNRLCEVYKDLGFGEDFLAGYASAVVGNAFVPEENIEMLVESQRNILRLFQQHVERRVQQAIDNTMKKTVKEVVVKAQLASSIFDTMAENRKVHDINFAKDVVDVVNNIYDGICASDRNKNV